MIWWLGALLSIVSDFLVTWLSKWGGGLDALLIGALQSPFDSHLSMASPPVSPMLPDFWFIQ